MCPIVNIHNHRAMYNQVANYAYLDTGITISIGMSAPNEYFTATQEQCATGGINVGTITGPQAFADNLVVNCIPASVLTWSLLFTPSFFVCAEQ